MSPSDFVSRGQALVVAGQYQEAVKVCRLGLLGRPQAVDGRLVLGQALLALRRYDEVLAEMRVAIEMESGNASAHMLKGEALLRKGDAYAASDALTRARSLAPGDPTIASLAGEADAAIAAGGGRRGGMGFGDFGDSMTKHYPSHRGTLPGEPGSKGFTKPTLVGGRSAPPRVADAIGEHSGTVEIDPDIEGVEVGRAYAGVDDDDVAEPPPPRASTEDVGDADVVEVEARDLIDPAGSAKLRGRSFAVADETDEATVAEKPPTRAMRRGLGPLDETPQPEPTAPRALSPARSASPGRSVPGAAARSPAPKSLRELEPALAKSAAAIDDLFPDEESKPSAGPGARGAVRNPAASSGRADDMATIRAGLEGARAATPPAVVAAAAAGRRAESTGVVVAPGAPGVPGALDAPGPGASSGTESVAAGARPRRVEPAVRERSQWSMIAWAVIAAVVVLGGVLAGFTIRRVRLQRQLAGARADATAAAHDDTWLGWQAARDLWAGVADVAGDAPSRAAVLRARAVLAAEFGDDVAGARFALSGDDKDSGEPDAAVARAYLSLLDGDAAAAQAATATAQHAAGAGTGDYLVGRAALVGQRWTDAAQSLGEAIKADARPAAYVALAEAEAGRGRYAEATAACDKALGQVPDHPRALIERARIAAASGAPAPVLAEAIAGLDGVDAEAKLPAAQEKRGVGPFEVALSALARAEVEHARGDDGAARRALERATSAAADDLRVSDGVIALHLALGDQARAIELAQHAAQAWPKSPGPRVALAAAALAAGDAGKALDALGQAGDLGDRPFALALRGRAHLAAGDLDAAASDLDAALAKAPDDELALLARSEVDLARGDAKAAAGRLASRAGAASASGALLVTYASALRAAGQRDTARPILDKLASAGGVLAGRALLERARLARDDGDIATARADFAKAIAALPHGGTGSRWIDARREAAAMQLDAGDVAGARAELDKLVAEASTDGASLVEAARAHTLTGDLTAAKELLDKAEQGTAAPRWKVARERGRLFVRQRQVGPAVEQLERAASLEPDDGETRLLLIDANILGKDDSAARRGLGDVLARFKGRPEASLAGGRVAYYFSKDAEAKTDFQAARDALVKAKAPARAIADATYWLGRVRYDDNPDEARKLLVEATTLDPTLADAYVFLGLIDVDKNDPKSAVTWFQKATALDADNLDTWFDLGQAAVSAKQPLVAKTAYTEYLHRAPNGDNAADARAALKKL